MKGPWPLPVPSAAMFWIWACDCRFIVEADFVIGHAVR